MFCPVKLTHLCQPISGRDSFPHSKANVRSLSRLNLKVWFLSRPMFGFCRANVRFLSRECSVFAAGNLPKHLSRKDFRASTNLQILQIDYQRKNLYAGLHFLKLKREATLQEMNRKKEKEDHLKR